MAFNLRKNLRLLIPGYGLNDLTTKRIAIFSILIPFLFGILAVWFSYTKVTFSEKKADDAVKRLSATREQLLVLKNQLDSSRESIAESDLRLKQIGEQYDKTRSVLRDSLRLQEHNIHSILNVYQVVQNNYRVMQDSNRIQSELLEKNTGLIVLSSKELGRLNDSIALLKKSLTQSKDSLEFAKADVQLMKTSLESIKGEAAKIKPLARSRTLFGHKDNRDRQLFEFAVWLDMPKELKKNILDVTYKYNLPNNESAQANLNFQSVTISDIKNDFKSTYTSWGCIKNMIIEVRFKNNLSTPLFFDLCSSLNNPLIEALPSH